MARGDYCTDTIVASRVAGVLGPVSIPIVLTWDPNNEGNPSGTNYLGKFQTTVRQLTAAPGNQTDGTMNKPILGWWICRLECSRDDARDQPERVSV